jgi:hypothetical protein
VGNNDRDTSEMWLDVTEKDLQLLVLRTLQKISVATAGGEASPALQLLLE